VTARSAPEDKTNFIQADLSTAGGTTKGINEILNHFHGTDIIVHNVGGSSAPSGGFITVTDELWQQAINENLFPALQLNRVRNRWWHNSNDLTECGNNSMTIKLPPIIQKYVDASNKHDVKSILSCVSDDAVVRDEGKMLHGEKAIEGWIMKTIEKYKFQFKPVSIKDEAAEVVVAMEVSGTFDGSLVTLDYRFAVRTIRSYLSQLINEQI
jgi:ketosteroid isomerase-like protein